MQYKEFNTKSMLEAGLMAAILVIAMLIEIYVPLMDIIFLFVLPLPITLVYVRGGFKYAVSSLIVGSVIGIIIVSPVLALPLIVDAGLVGLTLGFCIIHKLKAANSYFFITIAFLLAFIITIAMVSLMTDVKGVTGIVDEAINAYNSGMEGAKQIYISMGLNKQQVEQVFSKTNVMTKDTLLAIFPAVIIFSSVLFAYFYYKFTACIFRHLRIKINELRGFEFLYIPNLAAAVMIAVICIGLILQTRKIGLGNYIFTSGFSLFQIALFIQGSATVLYFLKRKLTSSKMAVIIIILTALILNIVYVYIGIAELIFDFRKLDPTRVKNIR